MTSPPTLRQLSRFRRFRWRHVGQYFLRGLLVLSPILITLSALVWAFRTVDRALHPYITAPGLGLAALVTLVILVGWVSSFFLMQRIFGLVDRGLEQMPGVSFIYSSVRDFLEAFVGNKRRFTQAVLVNVLADQVWLVGFLTDEDASPLNLGKDYVSVYVPQAYNVAGQLYLVKRDRVRSIEHLGSAEVMKYAVTGGAVEINEKD
ncbi:MAG: DUF502 domain-containing protein [Opitutaceae bacterium]|nr:DUF502 domain-containing protein [Opitutaceae bacterium]